MAFQAGYNKKVTWTPYGGSLATFNVTEHSWQEKIDKLDLTHSGSGGIQYLLAGILRGEGMFKANCDDAQVVSNSTFLIRAGQSGTMNFYVFASGSNPFVVPCMIVTAPFKSVVNGLATYECQVELNGLVDNASLTTAAYTRPS